MKKRQNKLLYLVSIVVVLTISYSCRESRISCKDYQTVFTTYPATVIAVVDGDTLKVQFTDDVPENCNRKETIRLVGVNTPELHITEPEYYAQEAAFYINELCYNKNVNIELDSRFPLRDKYDRLLAYVYTADSVMPINYLLIEEGYARYYDLFIFDKQRMSIFNAIEESAQINHKGMWYES